MVTRRRLKTRHIRCSCVVEVDEHVESGVGATGARRRIQVIEDIVFESNAEIIAIDERNTCCLPATGARIPTIIQRRPSAESP